VGAPMSARSGSSELPERARPGLHQVAPAPGPGSNSRGSPCKFRCTPQGTVTAGECDLIDRRRQVIGRTRAGDDAQMPAGPPPGCRLLAVAGPGRKGRVLRQRGTHCPGRSREQPRRVRLEAQATPHVHSPRHLGLAEGSNHRKMDPGSIRLKIGRSATDDGSTPSLCRSSRVIRPGQPGRPSAQPAQINIPAAMRAPTDRLPFIAGGSGTAFGAIGLALSYADRLRLVLATTPAHLGRLPDLFLQPRRARPGGRRRCAMGCSGACREARPGSGGFR